MVRMTLEATKPMFPHKVPREEPRVGTVAVFNTAFASGGGASTNMLIRTEEGWARSPEPKHECFSWETLTDIDTKNAAVQEIKPGSPKRVVAVEVQIISLPQPDVTDRLSEIHDDLFHLENKDHPQAVHYVDPKELRDRLEGVINELLAAQP
jgi:hypothetical protein